MNSNNTSPAKFKNRHGFTMVEMLVVISIIGILIGILLPTLSAARGNAARAGSMANMKQAYMLIQSYAQANRETVVPSTFDNSAALVKGKVRSEVPATGQQYKGTWADILWTDAGYGPVAIDPNNPTEYQYRFDNPDDPFYEKLPKFERTPFRSKAALLVPFDNKEGDDFISLDADLAANKMGSNATLSGVLGHFAANNFFDSRAASRAKTNHPFDATKGPYFTFGELARPEICAYLIDSNAGETVDPVDTVGATVRPFEITDPDRGQIAFRYPGESCLILLLDGHVQGEAKWDTLVELEGVANNRNSDGTSVDPSAGGDPGRGVRFRHLDMR